MALKGGVSNLNDAIIRSVEYQIGVNGLGALNNLQAAMRNVQAAQRAAEADRRAGTISANEYQQAIAKLAQQERELEGQIKLTNAAIANGNKVTDDLVAKMKKSEGAAQKTSYAFFQVAYAIDDMQYGLPALTNNIVGLTTGMLGNSAAVAGVATALVGAMAIYKNWNAIVQAGKDIVLAGIPVHKDARKEMEELSKATDLSADKQARLNQLREKFARIDAQAGIEGAGARSHREAVDNAIAEGGGMTNARDALTGVYAASGVTQDPAMEQAIKEKEQRVAGLRQAIKEGARDQDDVLRIEEGRLKAMKDKYGSDRIAKGKELAEGAFAAASMDPKQLDALISVIETNWGAFEKESKGLLGELMNARKADREAQGTLETQGEIRGEKIAERQRQLREGREAAESNRSQTREGAISKAVGDMQKGFVNERALGMPAPDFEGMKKRLTDSGLDDRMATEIAGDVLAALIKKAEEAFVSKAREMGQGVTPEQAKKQMGMEIQQEAERQRAAAAKGDAAKQRALDAPENREVKKHVSDIRGSIGARAAKRLKNREDPASVRQFVHDAVAADPMVPANLRAEVAAELIEDAENKAAGINAVRDVQGRGMAGGAVEAASGWRTGAGGKKLRKTRLSELRDRQGQKVLRPGSIDAMGGRNLDPVVPPRTPELNIEPGSVGGGGGQVQEQMKTNTILQEIRDRGINANVKI